MDYGMSHSKDLRRRVVSYVRGGGSKATAARLFGVSRGRIYIWLGLGDELATGLKPGPKRGHKLDEERLRAELLKRPDAMLKELAALFQVRESTVHYGLKRLKISRKKNLAVRRKPAP
jgi:transposase